MLKIYIDNAKYLDQAKEIIQHYLDFDSDFNGETYTLETDDFTWIDTDNSVIQKCDIQRLFINLNNLTRGEATYSAVNITANS